MDALENLVQLYGSIVFANLGYSILAGSEQNRGPGDDGAALDEDSARAVGRQKACLNRNVSLGNQLGVPHRDPPVVAGLSGGPDMEDGRRPNPESDAFDQHIRTVGIAAPQNDVSERVDRRVVGPESVGDQVDVHRLLRAFTLGNLAVLEAELSPAEPAVDEERPD